MSVGCVYPPEWKSFTDSVSGVNVRQLTNYKGHSHHFYFTNPCWYAGGRNLLFGSDRQNRSNLFSIDLESGEITQLTDLESAPPPFETEFIFSCVNPTRDEAYLRGPTSSLPATAAATATSIWLKSRRLNRCRSWDEAKKCTKPIANCELQVAGGICRYAGMQVCNSPLNL
jgi:hypothetical protein